MCPLWISGPCPIHVYDIMTATSGVREMYGAVEGITYQKEEALKEISKGLGII